MKQQKALSLSLISDITTRINSEQDLHSLLTVIMDTARELLDTEGASLLLYDEASQELIFDIARGDRSTLLAEKRIPKGAGIAGMCAERMQPIVVSDAQNDDRVLKSIDEQSGFITRNLVAVPMMARDRLIGVLEAVNTADNRDFTKTDVRLLTYLSNMAGLAIYNRKLYDDLKNRAEEINCIYEISRTIPEQEKVQDMLESILKAIERVLEVERLSVVICENNEDGEDSVVLIRTLGFELKSQDGISDPIVDPQSGIVGKVLDTGEALLIRDIKTELDGEFAGNERYKTGSFISVPVQHEGKTIGVLNAADKKNGMPFDDFELKVLSTVASQLASAYSRMLSRKREMQMQIYRKDMEVAAQIQQNSLPVIPGKIAGLELAARYHACRDVGGDFYDFHYHSDNLMSFVIADVSGKGVPAALFMEYSKTLLSANIPIHMHPVRTLEVVNRELANNSRMGLFVTVMLVQLERDLNRFRIASAGHNNQILVRAKTGEVEMLSAGGPPLGAFEEAVYKEKIVDYEPGDTLILYTDGITEAHKEDFHMFGEDRLFDLVKGKNAQSAEELTDLIFNEVERFAQGAEASDDATLMVVKL